MQRREKLNFLHSFKVQKTITLTNICLHVQCTGLIILNYHNGLIISHVRTFKLRKYSTVAISGIMYVSL